MKIYWIVASCLILVGIVIISEKKDLLVTTPRDEVAFVDQSDRIDPSPEPKEEEIQVSANTQSPEIMSAVSSNTKISKRYITPPIADAPKIQATVTEVAKPQVSKSIEPLAEVANPQVSIPIEPPTPQAFSRVEEPRYCTVVEQRPVTSLVNGTVLDNRQPCFECCAEPYYLDEDVCCDPCESWYNPVCASCEYWQSPLRLTLSHVEGHWLDNHEGYTSLGLFDAVYGDGYHCPLAFVDIREHVFNNGKNAANIGGGLRYGYCNSVLGVNAYYDYRQASWNQVFRQLGVGFEFLHPCVDVRFNMYFPVGDHHRHSSTKVFDHYIGDFKATCREHRKSVGGGDLEFGRYIFCKGPCDCYDLYAAIGSYYYDYTRHHDQAFGGQVRLLSHVGRFLTFEIKGGYDPVFHGQVQGRATVSIPLDCLCSLFNDCGCCSTCSDGCCILYTPVVRQEVIALEHKKCCWTWNW